MFWLKRDSMEIISRSKIFTQFLFLVISHNEQQWTHYIYNNELTSLLAPPVFHVLKWDGHNRGWPLPCTRTKS